MAYLQRKGLKPSQDEKYVKLITKLRDFLKNEINRMLNRIVDIYKLTQSFKKNEQARSELW
jgi:hypothetical protein